MKSVETDVVVIGAGTAGMLAFEAAVREGARAMLIEAGAYGTTCARVGCMPSKLLIAAAERAHLHKTSSAFGVHAEAVRVDGQEVLARVRRERDRFIGFTLDEIATIPQSQRLRGMARFHSRNCLTVSNECEVKFRSAVIATGSSPFVPPELECLGERLLVNDDIFELEALPDSVIVIGLGVIALELGQALHRLGVDVSFVGRSPKLGIFTDPELVREAYEVFCKELNLITPASVLQVVLENDQVKLTLDTPGGAQVLKADYVLAATGRRANLEDLELFNCGLDLDERGVPDCDSRTMQCGNSNIFIAGDATGCLPFQHEAADEGRIAGRNAARFPDVQEGIRRSHLSIVFSDPQMATVGTLFRDLTPGTFICGRASFVTQGRSRILGVNRGMLKIYADSHSGQLLGAEVLGPHAEHLGHLLAWAHQQQLTVQEMLNMPYYHPVIEEGIRTALGHCRRELINLLPGGEPTLGVLA